jgi:hypothetical protein
MKCLTLVLVALFLNCSNPKLIKQQLRGCDAKIEKLGLKIDKAINSPAAKIITSQLDTVYDQIKIFEKDTTLHKYVEKLEQRIQNTAALHKYVENLEQGIQNTAEYVENLEQRVQNTTNQIQNAGKIGIGGLLFSFIIWLGKKFYNRRRKKSEEENEVH